MILTDLQPHTTERVWTVEDIPVLTARLSVPEPASADSRIARRLRRYYRLQLRAYLRYCERFLLPQAEAEFRAALTSGGPLPCFKAELDYRITCREGTLLSLFVQARETGSSGRFHLTRWGDTWDLSDGYPLPPHAFFPPKSNWKKQLLAFAESGIQRQESLGIARFHDGFRRRLRRHFNPRNYYLTPEGLTFFFPMYSIAPATEGIPSFTVPFGQFGLQLPANAETRPPS